MTIAVTGRFFRSGKEVSPEHFFEESSASFLRRSAEDDGTDGTRCRSRGSEKGGRHGNGRECKVRQFIRLLMNYGNG